MSGKHVAVRSQLKLRIPLFGLILLMTFPVSCMLLSRPSVALNVKGLRCRARRLGHSGLGVLLAIPH